MHACCLQIQLDALHALVNALDMYHVVFQQLWPPFVGTCCAYIPASAYCIDSSQSDPFELQ